MPPKARFFNPAEYIDTPEVVAAFLNEALQTKDVSYIANAFGIVAESPGVEAIADYTGLNCAELCLAVSEQDNPTFASMLAVLDALQLNLVISTHSH